MTEPTLPNANEAEASARADSAELKTLNPPDPELSLMVEPSPVVGNETVHPFLFTGGAGEYFRIWVVNVFLTLVTVGLWSPWAKIRKKRWFLGHTWVAGANFDFHANPWPMFRGRVLAAAAVFVYWLAGEFNPRYAAALALGLLLIAPVLVIGTLRFNLANTSYRNLRFSSQASVKDAMWAFVPLVAAAALAVAFPVSDVEMSNPSTPTDLFKNFGSHWKVLLSSILLLIFYPYVHGKFRMLVLDHSHYGSAPIRCSTRVKTFYSSHIRGSVVGLGAFVLAFALVAVLGFFAAFIPKNMPQWIPELDFVRRKEFMVIIGIIFVTPIILASLVWYAATQIRLINGTFNLTRIGDNVRVRSKIDTWSMSKLYLVNSLAIVFTAGLAIPWAAVRTAKQRVETTGLVVTGDLDGVVAAAISSANPAADAATEFLSLDVSL